MQSHTRSSISLPPDAHAAVLRLRDELGLASNADVIRRALAVLEAQAAHERLAREIAEESLRVRRVCAADYAELDPLAGEGLDGW